MDDLPYGFHGFSAWTRYHSAMKEVRVRLPDHTHDQVALSAERNKRGIAKQAEWLIELGLQAEATRNKIRAGKTGAPKETPNQ